VQFEAQLYDSLWNAKQLSVTSHTFLQILRSHNRVSDRILPLCFGELNERNGILLIKAMRETSSSDIDRTISSVTPNATI